MQHVQSHVLESGLCSIKLEPFHKHLRSEQGQDPPCFAHWLDDLVLESYSRKSLIPCAFLQLISAGSADTDLLSGDDALGMFMTGNAARCTLTSGIHTKAQAKRVPQIYRTRAGWRTISKAAQGCFPSTKSLHVGHVSETCKQVSKYKLGPVICMQLF